MKSAGQNVYESLVDDFIYNYDYDGSDNIIYLGKARPSTANGTAGWMIAKFTYSGVNMVTKRLADGNILLDNVWDDRATTVVYA